MIQTHQLTLRAGARTLVDQLNWRVEEGQCWSVIGRNGAGKSTLLRTLAGLLQPDAGSVSIGLRALRDGALEVFARTSDLLAQYLSDCFGYWAL